MLGWVVGGFPSGYLPVPCGPGHSSVSVREAGAPARIPYSPAPMVPFLVRMAADRIGVLEVMAKGQTSVWVVLRANSGELSVSPVLSVCVCVHLVLMVCCAGVCAGVRVLGRVWSVACIPVSGHW